MTLIKNLILENKKYYKLKVKKPLFKTFLMELKTLSLNDPILVDFNLISSGIIISEEDIKLLIKQRVCDNYFYKSLVVTYLGLDKNDVLDLNLYLEYLESMNNKVLKEGDLVCLTIDKKKYILNKMDFKKNEAIISSYGENNNYNLTLKVSIDKLEAIK